MPFDATTLPLSNQIPTSNQITDRLVAIGISPVPLTVVEEHKRKVIMNFSTSMRGRGLVRTGVAIWRTLHLYRNLEILECPRKHVGMTDDVSAAPRPIIQLAERVSREMRDAEFELEWFYTDPIVNVICSGHRACLGIWDNGRVVAIADHDGYVPPVTIADRSASFWRRWLRLR